MSRKNKNVETSPATPARLHSDASASPHVAKLVKALPPEQELSEFQLARVHRNVLASSRPRRTRVNFGFRATVVATLLIVGATVGAAAAMVSVRWFRNGAPQVEELAPERPAHAKRKRVVAALREPPPAVINLPETALPEAPPLVVAPAVPALKQSKPLGVVRGPASHESDIGRSRFATSLRPVAGPGVAPPATQASAVEDEAAAMSGALRLLRAGDRPAAIEQLRLYVQRFPQGAFAEEAQVALISALVQNGAHAEAEAALSKITGGASTSPALRLLRAELGFASVCAAPLQLFEDVLSSSPALRERALYGAAMANARCGDRARGKKLMHEFLQAYPQSPRTRSVAEHLQRLE